MLQLNELDDDHRCSGDTKRVIAHAQLGNVDSIYLICRGNVSDRFHAQDLACTKYEFGYRVGFTLHSINVIQQELYVEEHLVATA